MNAVVLLSESQTRHPYDTLLRRLRSNLVEATVFLIRKVNVHTSTKFGYGHSDPEQMGK
jgi:hypothetical protein